MCACIAPHVWAASLRPARAAAAAPAAAAAAAASNPSHPRPTTHLPPQAGDAQVDKEVYAELAATGKFSTMSRDVDEAEHSMELHMPYIVHLMRDQPFTLVPIMVCALSFNRQAGEEVSACVQRPSWPARPAASRPWQRGMAQHNRGRQGVDPPHPPASSCRRWPPAARPPMASCWPSMWRTPPTSL